MDGWMDGWVDGWMDGWMDSLFMQGMQRSEGRFSELISCTPIN